MQITDSDNKGKKISLAPPLYVEDGIKGGYEGRTKEGKKIGKKSVAPPKLNSAAPRGNVLFILFSFRCSF